MTLSHRIQVETMNLAKDPPPGISAYPDADNQRYFHVTMAGPKNSPYEGGEFELELFLPDGYPMRPPTVRFLTKIFHPNIDNLGRICLDILKSHWTPALQIRTVLLSVQALLRMIYHIRGINDALLKNILKDYMNINKVAFVSTSGESNQNFLLSAPNLEDPLADEVARIWRTDERTAWMTAKQWTTAYALRRDSTHSIRE